jgi:hypothetical protein
MMPNIYARSASNPSNHQSTHNNTVFPWEFSRNFLVDGMVAGIRWTEKKQINSEFLFNKVAYFFGGFTTRIGTINSA